MGSVSVKYTLDDAACRKAIDTPDVRRKVLAGAQSIAAAANGMYDASGYIAKMGSRYRVPVAFVITGDRHSINSNRLHNTLQKAAGGS